MAGGGGGGGRSLEQTPTWAVALVCFVLVLISIFIEYSIHLVGKWLTRNHKRALYEALEKLKSELMLLGFISLLLTVGQGPISEICISPRLGNSMLPCRKRPTPTGYNAKGVKYDAVAGGREFPDEIIGRKLLWTQNQDPDSQRILAGAAGGSSDKCAPKGKVPLVSAEGINQLHLFIFVLAVFHVLYCITTMALGRAKMKTWKIWEEECKSMEYQFSHDPERFRFARETTFGRRHLHFWSRTPVLIWIVCFFRQFVRSVPKVDYLTLRHGFIMAHLAPHSSMKFDFQQYIKRSLEDDFKVVVGISPIIWFVAVLFLLFFTHGWYSYFWLPFIPLIIILLVGTKLQVVITRMGLEIQGNGEVVKGVPVVRPADHLFWFNKPRLILYLIHFVLFQNAFQLAFFVWAWYQFGLHSCFHEHVADISIRLSMGLLIQFLCSYVTLPLYALVTQMGSSMRTTIFNERIAGALRRWHNTARKHLKEAKKPLPPSPLSSRPNTPRSTAAATGNTATMPSPLLKYAIENNNSPSPKHPQVQLNLKDSSSDHHHHHRQQESPLATDIEVQDGGPSDLKDKQFSFAK